MSDLTTLARVKLELGISSTANDTLLSAIISEASATVQSYCRRDFAIQTYSEKVSSDGEVMLQASNTPINSVTSIKFDTNETVDSDLYEIFDAKAGLIINDGGWRDTRIYKQELTQYPIAENKLYTLNYNAGYNLPSSTARDLPYDIERAALETIKQFYQARCRESALSSEKIGTYSASYNEYDIPKAAKFLLAPYVRHLVEAV